MQLWRGVAVAIVALVVGACSTLPKPQPAPSGARSVDGRISVRYKDLESGKEDALSGRFAWVANGSSIDLSLLDPLGQTVAFIQSTPDRSTITFRDGRKVEGESPEELTQRTLGYAVPLRGLAAWLDGQPQPGSPSTRLDDGRLKQDGWTLRFAAPDDGTTLPRRIDLYYPGPPAEIEIRLVVDQRGGP